MQFKRFLQDKVFEPSLFPALYINTAFFLILDYPQFEVHILILYLRTACNHPYDLMWGFLNAARLSWTQKHSLRGYNNTSLNYNGTFYPQIKK